eukprot:890240-Rhodomonas_salina.3
MPVRSVRTRSRTYTDYPPSTLYTRTAHPKPPIYAISVRHFTYVHRFTPYLQSAHPNTRCPARPQHVSSDFALRRLHAPRRGRQYRMSGTEMQCMCVGDTLPCTYAIAARVRKK